MSLRVSRRSRGAAALRVALMTGGFAIALAAASGVTLAAPPPMASPGAERQQRQLESLAEDFYAYVLPLVEVARRRADFLARYPSNRWAHRRTLSNHTAREVTTPNNDTIYSEAFLDLSNGPVTLHAPDTGKRYFSIALMDMYSNNFAYLGTRATGGEAAQLTLVAPGDPLPSVPGLVIHAPTRWVWGIARTLVTSEADLPAAIAVQDALSIEASPREAVERESVIPPAREANAAVFLRQARQLLEENPPFDRDDAFLEPLRAAGFFGDQKLSRAQISRIAEGFETAHERLAVAKRPGRLINGWIYPQANHGDYGTDYYYRAAVAISGLGAMIQDEATYLRSAPVSPDGLYDGNNVYRIRFAADALPPVSAFWSLSMYERTDDGGFYFVDNPIDRYAIGDRTAGLRYNDDGSLDLWLSHADPGEGRRENWLPAPAGPFALSLRAYLPDPRLLDASWQAPEVERVDVR